MDIEKLHFWYEDKKYCVEYSVDPHSNRNKMHKLYRI